MDNEGYTTPTPIQEQSIPIILNRRDLLGCAQTGTGKTAAFAIPMLQILYEEARAHSAGSKDQHGNDQHSSEPKSIDAPKHTGNHRIAIRPATARTAALPIKALILTPTRELAIQIDESFAAYGKYAGLKHLVIFGGVPQNPQTQALQRGVDILVATPGRLLDLIDQRYINLHDIKIFVLDEADRMLDMGFVHDVKKIIARLPRERQTLFFSATMPPEIQKLASTILVNPEKVEVTPASTTAETVQQSIYFVEKQDKRSLLLHILKEQSIPTALVFTRTKHGADKVAQGLTRAGIHAEAIHGNKSQNARQRALLNFKSRQIRILVATDIAARGIDIDELTHVINFELPNIPETYVHRIGRTGRAGASGIAISFCDAEEKEYLHDIQKLLGNPIPVAENNPFAMQATFFQQRQSASRPAPGNRASGNNNQRNPPPGDRRGTDRRNTAGPDRRNVAGGNGNTAGGSQRSGRPPVKRSGPPVLQVQGLQQSALKRAEQQQAALQQAASQQSDAHLPLPEHAARRQPTEHTIDLRKKAPQPPGNQHTGYQQSIHQHTGVQQAANQKTGHQKTGHQHPGHSEEGHQHSGLPFPVNQIAGDERL